MNYALAFCVLAAVYYVGEFIGTRTKSWVPSVFITACIFLVGYWTVFPADIVDQAGLGAPLGGMIAIMLCVTHMGTITSIHTLLEQWKTIVIAAAGLAGLLVIGWFVCVPIIGREQVLAALPPLTGGIVAAKMMSQAALDNGYQTAAVLAISVWAIQGFVGYPLTAALLKIESKKLVVAYRSGGADLSVAQSSSEKPRKKLIPPVPAKYRTTSLILGKLMLTAFAANLLGQWTGLHQVVWALILSIVLTELGFLEEDALNQAKSYGFCMFALMISCFAGLKDATPQILTACIGPMILVVVIGVLGLAILSMAAGKFLGISWNMATAISLTALYGFPPNYILTENASKSVAQNEAEEKYLMDKMLPMMIVGGFVTVTISSVIIAGIFINML